MRIRFVPTRSFALAASLVASVLPVHSAAAETTATALDLKTVSVGQRASLPGSTTVRFGSRVVSVATLLAEHGARLKRFADAAALGRANSTSNEPIANRIFLFHGLPGPIAAPKIVDFPVPKPLDVAKLQPQTIFDADRYRGSNSDVWHVGNDYVDYCIAAKATICLYLPGGSPMFSFRATSGNVYAEDIDPFIDSTGCNNFNGYYSPTGSNPGCELFYPVSDDRHFTPGPPDQTNVSGKCDASDGFTGTNDSHGYVRAQFSRLTTDYTPQNALTLNDVTTCVIRVATPPGVNP